MVHPLLMIIHVNSLKIGNTSINETQLRDLLNGTFNKISCTLITTNNVFSCQNITTKTHNTKSINCTNKVSCGNECSIENVLYF